MRSELAISAGAASGRDAQSASDMQRYATPGPSRAARPERWMPAAFDSREVTSPDMRRFASSRGPRARPESTTMLTPGTVSADSATEVVTMTRRPGSISCPPVPVPDPEPAPCGRRIASCSFAGVRPVSVCTLTASPVRVRSDVIRAATSSTSRAPGAKTRTSPAVPASAVSSARTVVCARWSRKFWLTPRASRARSRGGAQAMRSGCVAAVRASTGAGRSGVPSRAAQSAASRVADMTTRLRSSRSSVSSRHIANVRSVSRWRSCTSSRMTPETPASSGSASIRRSSTPVVTNSIRVRPEVVDSPRTVKPTSSPRRVPVSWASRLAAARAAIRRGWVTMIRPDPASGPAVVRRCPAVVRRCSAMSGGMSVVLPVPGGASTTRRGNGSAGRRSMSAAAGSPAPIASRSKWSMTPVSQDDPTRRRLGPGATRISCGRSSSAPGCATGPRVLPRGPRARGRRRPRGRAAG